MNSPAADARPRITIVGGGLAGLAAAVALAESDCQVELFEARRSLGGRAGSFRDPATGEQVDHCQHVSMGCCTNLADLCRRIGVGDAFRRIDTLHFVGPDGSWYDLKASRLPAPLHLAPAFWRMKYLSAAERYRIGRAMWKLMRETPHDLDTAPSVGRWLRMQRQSTRAIEQFWGVILTSALGEDLDRASLPAARKVIVDGFLSARDGYVVEVPEVPLSALYGATLERWLTEHGVGVHLGTPVRCVSIADGPRVDTADGTRRPDYVVLAVPWFKLAEMVDASLAEAWPWLAELSRVEASPITGVHLWFDRPIASVDHAVIVGRLSQWMFRRSSSGASAEGHYYQVVISASRGLAGREKDDVVAEVCRELGEIFPEARDAELLRSRIVTDRAAVFSARPGFEQLRPAQGTAIPGVLLAGDWTDTGWPATMESAVRSGYLTAEAILAAVGRTDSWVRPDLPRGWLASRLIR